VIGVAERTEELKPGRITYFSRIDSWLLIGAGSSRDLQHLASRSKKPPQFSFQSFPTKLETQHPEFRVYQCEDQLSRRVDSNKTRKR
jgi:hypothetical protein